MRCNPPYIADRNVIDQHRFQSKIPLTLGHESKKGTLKVSKHIARLGWGFAKRARDRFHNSRFPSAALRGRSAMCRYEWENETRRL